jgi:hypothetical protein
MGEWHGPERRRNNDDDHDLLTRIDENLVHVKEWCVSHKEEDDQKHADNLVKFEALNKTVSFHSKMIFMALGVIAFIEFVAKVVK